MKKYIRACLSLDSRTIDKIKALTNYYGKTKSEIIRLAIRHYYLYKPAEEINNDL